MIEITTQKYTTNFQFDLTDEIILHFAVTAAAAQSARSLTPSRGAAAHGDLHVQPFWHGTRTVEHITD